MPRYPALLFALLTTAVRVTAAPDAKFDPATTATNQLGLELFRALATERPSENLLISPYSIQSALAMTYAGAEGETRTEMARVLHYPGDDAILHGSFLALRNAFDAAVEKSKADSDRRQQKGGKIDPLELRVANRLFGQSGYAFRAPFLALTKGSYDAPLEQLDFRTNSEPSRLTINHWVEEQTRQRIRDLLPEGSITDLTRLVLVNALYFKAPWSSPFRKALTENRPFRVNGTKSEPVPTMQHQSKLGYRAFGDFSAIALPYASDDFQFLILLPNDPAGLEALNAKLTPALLRECAQLKASSLLLFLPKLRIAGPTITLQKPLKALGMKTAFQPSANFDRISPDKLRVSEVFHKTFLALDEEGSEAAAATAVVMALRSAATAPQPTPEIHVDRPFLFAIQHRSSGTCLFIGRVTDPR